MLGVASYSGDLTKEYFSPKTLGPAISANIKYPVMGNFLYLRAGLAYGIISGDDKHNDPPSTYLARNLNFKSHIIEGSICLEANVLNPEEYYSYPYFFGGIGLFHFNPYTRDSDDKKIHLWDLGTEGQGLAPYPDKKMYSLTQVCFPFGGGWKYKINNQIDVVFELGGRLLFTDHLDDVSGVYADPQVLLNARGPKAMELAYRGPAATVAEGAQRGNSKLNDWYFLTGFKLQYKF